MISKVWGWTTGRYVIMGGASAVSNITLLIIFDLLFKRWLSAEGVYAASAVVGLAVTYVLQRRFVWRSRAAFHREAPKFFTVAGVMFVVNLGCISVFVGHLKFPLIATQCVLMAALSGITFLSSKYWTFRT